MTGAQEGERRRWRGGHRGGKGGGSSGDAGSPSAPAADGGQAVETFNGPHKWLSNFSWSALDFEGERYPSVEHAFQAAKLRTNAERRSWGFTRTDLSFGEAKRLGRRVPLREDWRDVREGVMATCLAAKFSDPALRAKLLATGSRELVDGHWGSPDLVWGYHVPSKAGENRLGHLVMKLRSELRSGAGGVEAPRRGPAGATQAADDDVAPAPERAPAGPLRGHAAALYHLDWPMKCLHDGLPRAYADRIASLAAECSLGGGPVELRGRMICIALRGAVPDIDAWERRMRTEAVDVNSKGRPCRERMLVQLARRLEPDQQRSALAAASFSRISAAHSWAQLCETLTPLLGLPEEDVRSQVGPEWPALPSKVRYLDNRAAVELDGRRFPLCLNDNDAPMVADALLGPPHEQRPRGAGREVPLAMERGRPSIFGGRFARELAGVLDEAECSCLVQLSERLGFGLAGSRGLNPQARFALRCLADAPQVAAAMTARLADLLPAEYPPDSGRPLIGVNQRLRFLKYLPGMHHCGDHTDCAHEEPRGRSFLTVQLYLNSAFRGGRTTFVSDRLVPVEPSAGGVVVFDHELCHRGGVVTEGTKYAIRMDVLYGHPSGAAAKADERHRAPPHERPRTAPQRAGRWVKRGGAQ